MIKNTNKGEVSVERIYGGNFKGPVSKTDASHPASSTGLQQSPRPHHLALTTGFKFVTELP